MMNSGVYAIENVVNGKRYIGSTGDFAMRERTHFGTLRRGVHAGRHLQNAFNRYGEGSFRFEVLEEWEPEFMVSMEQWWINMLRPEYNIAQTASAPALGLTRSEETKQRMSASMRGIKKGRPWSPARRAAFKSRPLTEDHKHKISEGHIGKIRSKDAIEKTAAAKRGISLSEDHKHKISAAIKDKWSGEEYRQQMSVAHLGKTLSKEQKRKIGEASKGNTYRLGCKLSEEHKQKLSEANKGNTYSLGYRHTAEAKAKISAASKEAWIIRRQREAACETS